MKLRYRVVREAATPELTARERYSTGTNHAQVLLSFAKIDFRILTRKIVGRHWAQFNPLAVQTAVFPTSHNGSLSTHGYFSFCRFGEHLTRSGSQHVRDSFIHRVFFLPHHGRESCDTETQRANRLLEKNVDPPWILGNYRRTLMEGDGRPSRTSRARDFITTMTP